MAGAAPFYAASPDPQRAAMEDDAADDAHAVVRELRLSCGSAARSVATTTSSALGRHYVAVCGGARVVLAELSELGTTNVVCDRQLDDAQGGQSRPARKSSLPVRVRVRRASKLVERARSVRLVP